MEYKMSTIASLIESISNEDTLSIEAQFDDLMAEKVADKIDNMKSKVAIKFFNVDGEDDKDDKDDSDEDKKDKKDCK